MVNYTHARSLMSLYTELRRDGQNCALRWSENKQDLPGVGQWVCGTAGNACPVYRHSVISKQNKKHFCRAHICQWFSAYLTVTPALLIPHGKNQTQPSSPALSIFRPQL